MSIITEKWDKMLNEEVYLENIINDLNAMQEENNYTDEEMDNDLQVALWRAYVYNNMDSYEYYELSEKTLAKVKDEGVKNGIWCYRYSCALVYLRRFDEALEYSRLGTKVDPTYPWGWLQLGRLCYKYNLLDEAFNAIDKGLELVPNDYEFLTLKDDIENDRGYAYANSHYINEEVDKSSKERLINIDDEELYQAFVNKSELEKELDILHKQDKNQEIIDIINSLPKEELDYNILGKLGRAYNNNNQCEEGLKVLLSVKDEGEKDSLWNFRVGYSYYYSEKAKENPEYLENAKKYFEKCLELNSNEPDGDTLLRWVYSDLGNRKIQEEKIEEALEYFKKARNLAKNDDDVVATESELAWAYDQVEEYEKALESLQKAISLGRDDIWLHSELGYCLEGLKRFDESLEEFKKAEELGRDDVWIYSALGLAYKRVGKIKEALENFSKAKELGRDDEWLLEQIGFSYGENGEYEKALNIYNSLLEKDSEKENGWLYYQIGCLKNRMNKFEEGIENLLKALEFGFDTILGNSELGWTYAEVGKYEKACECLLKAFELGRDDAWIIYELGYNLGRAGENKKAIEYLKKLETMENIDVELHNLYSELAWNLKEIGQEKEAWEYISKIKPEERDDGWLNYMKGSILTGLGKYGEAVEYFKKASDLGANSVLFYSQYGFALGKIEGRTNEALYYLNKAVELGRDDAWIWAEIGYDKFDLGEIEEGIKCFEKSISYGREDDFVYSQLGWGLKKIGENERALECFLRAKSFLKNKNPWIEFNIGVTYENLKRYKEAIQCFENIIEMGEYFGWTHLELAKIYSDMGDIKITSKYLNDVKKYLNLEEDSEAKKEYEEIQNKLFEGSSFLM